MDLRACRDEVFAEAVTAGFTLDQFVLKLDDPGLGWIRMYLAQVSHTGRSWEFIEKPDQPIRRWAWVAMLTTPVPSLDHFMFVRRRFGLRKGLGAPLGGRVARRFQVHGWPREALAGLLTPALAQALRAVPRVSWKLSQSTIHGSNPRQGSLEITWNIRARPHGGIVASSLDVLRAIRLVAPPGPEDR